MLEGVSQACSRISSNAMIYEGTCAPFHAKAVMPHSGQQRCGRHSTCLFVSGISIKIDLTDTHTYQQIGSSFNISIRNLFVSILCYCVLVYLNYVPTAEASIASKYFPFPNLQVCATSLVLLLVLVL